MLVMATHWQHHHSLAVFIKDKACSLLISPFPFTLVLRLHLLAWRTGDKHIEVECGAMWGEFPIHWRNTILLLLMPLCQTCNLLGNLTYGGILPNLPFKVPVHAHPTSHIEKTLVIFPIAGDAHWEGKLNRGINQWLCLTCCALTLQYQEKTPCWPC